MRTYQQWSNYNKLEFRVTCQSQSASESRQRIQLPSLNRVGRYFSQVFALSNEPQIREIVEAGKTQWRIYDPQSDRTLQLESPQEVSIWLEEHHYNRPQDNVWN